MPIRLVLAEDNALLRQGLVRLVEADPELVLVGHRRRQGRTARAGPCRSAPDVVVSDIRMPPTGTDEGVQVATILREELPETGVVLLSQHADVSYALALLEGGSSGRAYLLKERVADVGELTAAIRTVAAAAASSTRRSSSSSCRANLGGQRSRLDPLTPRELEVLGEMAQGSSNATIAASLVLSERAIEKHTNSIFSKLGLSEERDLNRRVAAVLVYLSESEGG